MVDVVTRVPECIFYCCGWCCSKSVFSFVLWLVLQQECDMCRVGVAVGLFYMLWIIA